MTLQYILWWILMVHEIYGNEYNTGFDDLDRIVNERRRLALTTTPKPTTTTTLPYMDYEDPPQMHKGKSLVLSEIEINKIPNEFGMIITQTDKLCFPTNNWVVRSLFEPNGMIGNYMRIAEIIEKNLQKFKGKDDMPLPIIANQTPIVQVPITVDETSENVNLLKKLMQKTRMHYLRLKPLFKAMASGVKTAIPYLTASILEKAFPGDVGTLAKSVVMDVTKKLIQARPNLDYGSRDWSRAVTSVGEGLTGTSTLVLNKLDATVDQLTDAALSNFDSLTTFEEIVQAFLHNRVSPKFYAENEMIREAIAEARKVAGTNEIIGNVDSDLDTIFTLPLTSVQKRDGDKDGDKYDIYTVLPLTRKRNVFTAYTIETIPITRDSTAYRQFQPTHPKIIVQGKNAIYIDNPDDYQCLESRVDQECRMCFIITNPKKVIDNCMIAILRNDGPAIETNCPYITDPELSDVTTRINEREWAYSIHEMAKIKTICPNQKDEVEDETVSILPKSGIIKFPETSDCVFQFQNGPFKTFQPFLPNLNVTIQQYNVKQREKLIKLTKLEEIKHHFQEYAILYIIGSLIGIISITSLIILIVCCKRLCIKIRQNKARRQLRQRQTRRENVELIMTSPERIIRSPPINLQDLQPPWAVSRRY